MSEQLWTPEAPPALEPAAFTIQQDHPYKSRGKGKPGCAACKRGKYHPDHLGAPPSMNDGGSGMDRMAYQTMKKAWQEVMREGLEGSGLPRGLEAVTVEALLGFPTRAGRDEDNYRWFLAKALGDTLTAGGWLPDDTFWPTRRYTFGGLEARLTPKTSSTTVMIYPSLAAPVPQC